MTKLWLVKVHLFSALSKRIEIFPGYMTSLEHRGSKSVIIFFFHLDKFWDVEFDCVVESFKSSKLRPTCDVTSSIYAQNTTKISQMLITSLLNGIKSRNLAFRLILGSRSRLCSRKFQIFKIEAQLWRHVVHLGPNYTQNLSNVNNFSIKWNKKLKLGIVIFKNLNANGKQKKRKENNIVLLMMVIDTLWCLFTKRHRWASILKISNFRLHNRIRHPKIRLNANFQLFILFNGEVINIWVILGVFWA